MTPRRIGAVMAVALGLAGCASAPEPSRPEWFFPRNAPLGEVYFPFKFTFAFNEVADATALPAGENEAVTYRIPDGDGGSHVCMRVREANYSRTFREGNFACFLNGYRFRSAEAMNAFITYRRTGETLEIEGFRRQGGRYVPIEETAALIAMAD